MRARKGVEEGEGKEDTLYPREILQRNQTPPPPPPPVLAIDWKKKNQYPRWL
jgi:hypothetical protein